MLQRMLPVINFKRFPGMGLSDAKMTKLELCEKISGLVPGFMFFEAQIGEDPYKRDYLVSNEKIELTGFRPAY